MILFVLCFQSDFGPFLKAANWVFRAWGIRLERALLHFFIFFLYAFLFILCLPFHMINDEKIFYCVALFDIDLNFLTLNETL